MSVRGARKRQDIPEEALAAATPLETIDYVVDMILTLHRLAATQQYDFLTYLLEMAATEAVRQRDEEQRCANPRRDELQERERARSAVQS